MQGDKILMKTAQEHHATFKKTIDLYSQNIKIYFEANISYNQGRFGLI